MYNVSSAFRTAMKNPVQEHRVTGTIGSISFTEANIVEGSFQISNQCSTMSDVVLGSVYTGQLTAEFTGINIAYGSWINKVITPTFALKVGDISWESVPLGIYIVKEAKHTANGVQVTAYDRMIKFDKKFKKPIPEFPYRVGVVTSATGAAIEDIRKIITAKNDFTDILVFPTAVQGIGAVNSICENIRAANSLNRNGIRIDTLIVGRGGGSPEDLAAFNDEEVARAIFASEIPVISAVGHEIDFSISDFVADARAETPTAAADMAVMDTYKLKEDIERSSKTLLSSIEQIIASERRVLDSAGALLKANIRSKLSEASSAVDKAVIMLRENDPRRVFSKGYAAVIDRNGKIVPNAAGITIGKEYDIVMSDGRFSAEVTDVDLN